MNHLRDRHLPLNLGVDKGDANKLSTGGEQDELGYSVRELLPLIRDANVSAQGLLQWVVDRAQIALDNPGEDQAVFAVDEIQDCLADFNGRLNHAIPSTIDATPIETPLALAITKTYWRVVGWANWTEYSEAIETLKNPPSPHSIYMAHQVEVSANRGKTYRVDFLVATTNAGTGQPILVAVECDGHEFHSRTKEQAASDRQRDRALLSLGITTVRFTGSEIWRDASACADELLTIVYTKRTERPSNGATP